MISVKNLTYFFVFRQNKPRKIIWKSFPGYKIIDIEEIVFLLFF